MTKSSNRSVGQPKFFIALGLGLLLAIVLPLFANSPQKLFIAYPPAKHQTTSDRIFFIGTAPLSGQVLVNQQPIGRSKFGHFAPSFMLQPGKNQFLIQYQNQSIGMEIDRISSSPEPPQPLGLIPDSLFPPQNTTQLLGELTCFRAIGTAGAVVTVAGNGLNFELVPENDSYNLPPNSAVLTNTSQVLTPQRGVYSGCTRSQKSLNIGRVAYTIRSGGKQQVVISQGGLQILGREQLQSIVITSPQAIARSGAGAEFSRLTTLPQGTQSLVMSQTGNWLRLEYGGWVEKKETRSVNRATPAHSKLKSVNSLNRQGWTDILFPLEVAVPISIRQESQKLTLTLHHVTAQTDTTLVVQNPIIDRMDGFQTNPDRVEFTFTMKTNQQWGYTTRYDGNVLVLSFRHPPKTIGGTRILLDPGHGSSNDLGSRGPTGYPEKDVALIVSKLVAQALRQRGFEVIMTREGDQDLFPQQRALKIEQFQPTIALSIHYNALPDHGNAQATKGISTFWYQPQSHRLAQFLHDYLTQKLDRDSYGVFWNNLALTRPTVAPSVLLELGFMIHPEEFNWITDPKAQQQLSETLATGISLWLQSVS